MKTISGAPLTLRIVKKMSRSHIRGAGILTRLFTRMGMLNVISQYEVGRGKFSVPVSRIPWDFFDLVNYELDFVNVFCRALTPLRSAVLLDCGADIGTFSALLSSRTDRIAHILAFEPSEAAHEFLNSNLSNLALPFTLIPKAVSSFRGHGCLKRPQDNLTDHARFLSAGEGGVDVITLDSLNIRSGDIALKLDIEGGEFDALRGAQETIIAARECVVGLEANPTVMARTGLDPIECLRFLHSLRPFRFLVAETGESPSLSAPVLRHGQTEIWNIVGWTYDQALI